MSEMEEREEQTIGLTIKEVLLLKKWFLLVKHHSNMGERDRTLADKLAMFEADMDLKRMNERNG